MFTHLLTIPEVGRRLRLKKSATYALLRSGRLPSVVVGKGARRVRADDLVAFIASLEATTPGGGSR